MDCPHLGAGIRITRNWLTTQMLLPPNGDLRKQKSPPPKEKQLLASASHRSKSVVASSSTAESASSTAAECEEKEQQWRCSGKHFLFFLIIFIIQTQYFNAKVLHLLCVCVWSLGGALTQLALRLASRPNRKKNQIRKKCLFIFDIPHKHTYARGIRSDPIHNQPQGPSSSR